MTGLLAVRDGQLLAACLTLAALSATALGLLARPTSFLSRLVDRGTDERTTR